MFSFFRKKNNSSYKIVVLNMTNFKRMGIKNFDRQARQGWIG